MGVCYIFSIAGNFRGGLIFVIFVTSLTVTKFTPHKKFSSVGKGRLVELLRVCMVKTHGICLQSVESLRSSNTV